MTDRSQPAPVLQFAIEVEGVLDPRWVEWFNGSPVTMTPSVPDAGRTCLVVTLPDQAALPAFLARVTGLNLKVLSVRPRGPAEWK